MATKKRSGGRVTPKGTQPAATEKRGDDKGRGFTPPESAAERFNASPVRSVGQHGPSRSGRRGQR